ncbi:MAG: helix-turn-helix domain-containing protein [Candidatus Limnocylindrales bacterium]
MPRPPSDWITLGEAAEMFAAGNIAISRDTLARWAKSGKIQSIRPGRLIYVRRAQIRSLLTPRRRGVPVDQLQSSLFQDWDG